MKKSYILLAALAVIGAFMVAKHLFKEPPASRVREELNLSEHAREAEFARDAVREFYRTPRKFAQKWTSTGDVYSDGVRLLQNSEMKEAAVAGAFRFKATPDTVEVKLESPGTTSVVVSVWCAGKELKISRIDPTGGGNE